ncbi:MAG: single-stranded DNA-binding protein [Nitrospirae bacterium]|nr:single-stranded DNA-binding protein [Nitrospirota bacterium]MBF0542629.1 single-stranded DNA-binding protein [Nitrospirota bacterium]
MINQLVLAGNLGGNPEQFFTPEGTQICTFSMAFRSTKKDKTCWIKVTAFNKLAEIIEKYLHKGDRVTVLGILDQEKWDSDDGTTKTAFKIIANSVEFHNPKPSEDGEEPPF